MNADNQDGAVVTLNPAERHEGTLLEAPHVFELPFADTGGAWIITVAPSGLFLRIKGRRQVALKYDTAYRVASRESALGTLTDEQLNEFAANDWKATESIAAPVAAGQ